jgi:hypothetical protein
MVSAQPLFFSFRLFINVYYNLLVPITGGVVQQESPLADDPAIQSSIESLSPEEIRAMSLVALGWLYSDIAKRLHRTQVDAILKSCREKTGCRGPAGLGVFYADHLLRLDTQGGYEVPGEKYDAWVRAAQKRREQLTGLLSPAMRRMVMWQSKPENAELTTDELIKRLPPNLTVATARGYMSEACAVLRGLVKAEQDERVAAGLKPAYLPQGRVRMLVIAHLAPFTV